MKNTSVDDLNISKDKLRMLKRFALFGALYIQSLTDLYGQHLYTSVANIDRYIPTGYNYK